MRGDLLSAQSEADAAYRADVKFLDKLKRDVKRLASPDDTLSIPTIHGKRAEQIGIFIVAWSVLECELDGAFHVLFRTDATLAICLYANLGTKAKLDIVTSAVTMLSKPLGKRLTEEAHTILRRIDDLSTKARNTIAHGQLKEFEDAMTGKIAWELVRHVARKNAAIIVHPGNARHWAQQGVTALRLAQRWRSCVAKMHGRLDRLTLDDLEKVCLAQIRESVPARARPRKIPLPKKRDLTGRQTRLAKWPRT